MEGFLLQRVPGEADLALKHPAVEQRQSFARLVVRDLRKGETREGQSCVE